MTERTIPVPVAPDVDMFHVRAALAGPVADILIAAWREVAAGHVASGDYLAHLAPRYPYEGDPNMAAVVNDTPQAWWLEHGRAGFHLPSRWGSGKGKWKIGKHGQLYAVVPFRIASPIRAGGGATTTRRRQAMPQAVYRLTRGMEHGDRLSGFGTRYTQSKSYNYYRQIFAQFPERLAGESGYTWKASRFEGLTQTGMRRTPGGGTQSQYMTFRVITPDSPGWYIPPTPAYHFAERALDRAMPAITDVLQAAAVQDMTDAVLDASRGMFV